VRAAIARAREVGQVCAGLSTHGETALLVANKAGLAAFHAETSATFGVTMRTTDGTGSANAARAHHRWGAIDPALAATLASIKADLSRSPRALPPADMTVVLEAQAVADLLSFLAGAMDERSAAEGRSVFARPGGGTAVGERLFDPRITLRSDPADREHPSLPFDREGQPRAAQTWIEGGTLQALPRSRAYAAARGTAAIAAPGSWFMAGGDATVDQLIAGVDRGVLVSRLWYNRMVEPRTLLATGLTRDGTFAIENGALAGSVKNFRYNDSPLTLLKRVVALGKPERVGLASGVWVVPPMVVEGFHFESSSDAI
jgi:predicted Zn-dependent protease